MNSLHLHSLIISLANSIELLSSRTLLSENPQNLRYLQITKFCTHNNTSIKKQNNEQHATRALIRKKLKVMELSSSEDENDIAELQLQIQIAEVQHELEQQQDHIDQLEGERNTKLQTFTDGRYTDEVQECCISLLSLGNYIQSATCSRITVERLPAPSTINNMIAEASNYKCYQQLHSTPSIQTGLPGLPGLPSLVKSTKSQQQMPAIHLHCAIRKLAVQPTHWRFLTKSSQTLITSVMDLMTPHPVTKESEL